MNIYHWSSPWARLFAHLLYTLQGGLEHLPPPGVTGRSESRLSPDGEQQEPPHPTGAGSKTSSKEARRMPSVTLGRLGRVSGEGA